MNKIKIAIKNRWTGSILFEYEKENNTLKDTIIHAIKCGANLSEADLCGADLHEANLRGANLSEADLSRADLCGANLSEADLSRANLRGADLCGADLHEANLRGADLCEADLSRANLRGADLCGADLHEANLRGADLCGANLSRANLCGADLRGADLCGVTSSSTTSFYRLICPEKGSFIGYKKCNFDRIVELQILEDSKRSSATTRKCRCDKAMVLSITNIDETISYDEAVSKYDSNFIYRVGEEVQVSNFDEDRWNECSTGIHFFITREEAVNY